MNRRTIEEKCLSYHFSSSPLQIWMKASEEFNLLRTPIVRDLQWRSEDKSSFPFGGVMNIYVDENVSRGCKGIQWRFRVVAVILIRTLFNEPVFSRWRPRLVIGRKSCAASSWPALNTRIENGHAFDQYHRNNHAVQASLSDSQRRHSALESLTNQGFSYRNFCGWIYRDHYWLVVCAMEKSSVDLNFSHRKKAKQQRKAFKRSSDFFSRVVSHPSQPGMRVQKFTFHSKVTAFGMEWLRKYFLYGQPVCALVPAHHLIADIRGTFVLQLIGWFREIIGLSILSQSRKSISQRLSQSADLESRKIMSTDKAAPKRMRPRNLISQCSSTNWCEGPPFPFSLLTQQK